MTKVEWHAQQCAVRAPVQTALHPLQECGPCGATKPRGSARAAPPFADPLPPPAPSSTHGSNSRGSWYAFTLTPLPYTPGALSASEPSRRVRHADAPGRRLGAKGRSIDFAGLKATLPTPAEPCCRRLPLHAADATTWTAARDVYLCHPFLIHAAQRHWRPAEVHGAAPLEPVGELAPDRVDQRRSNGRCCKASSSLTDQIYWRRPERTRTARVCSARAASWSLGG